MSDSAVVTARRRAWWLGALVGAAFVAARLVPYLGAHIGRGLDTFDYRAASHLPIFSREFLGGPRPFGYPLYLMAVAHNEHVAVAGQLVLDTAAWLVLAVMVARATRDRRLAGAAFVAVLGVGAAFEPIQWDRIVSSEALSTAFAVGLLAALLWIRERWTGPRLALIGVLALLATIVRDSNGSFFGVVAVVLAVGVLARRLPVRILGLCAVFLVVAAAGSVSAGLGKRWEGPVKDVITIRLLNSPERLESLQHSGLPLSPEQIAAARGNCVSATPMFPCVHLVDPVFYDWIKKHGRPAYVHLLLKTPATTAWEPLSHLRDSVGTRVQTEVGTGTDEDAPVAKVFDAVFFVRNPVVLVVWSGLVLAAAAFVLARRRKLGVLAIAVGLVALTYPHLWLVWVGGALEVSRHSLLASIQLRLGLWLGTVWLIDALLAPRVTAPPAT